MKTQAARKLGIASAILVVAGCASEPIAETSNARPTELPLTEQRLLQSGMLECRRLDDINGPVYTVDGYPCPEGFFEVNGSH